MNITETSPKYTHDKLLSYRDICELIGCNRVTLWRMCQNGEFPKPLKILSNRRAWQKSDYQKWLDKIIANRDEKEGV